MVCLSVILDRWLLKWQSKIVLPFYVNDTIGWRLIGLHSKMPFICVTGWIYLTEPWSEHQIQSGFIHWQIVIWQVIVKNWWHLAENTFETRAFFHSKSFRKTKCLHQCGDDKGTPVNALFSYFFQIFSLKILLCNIVFTIFSNYHLFLLIY